MALPVIHYHQQHSHGDLLRLFQQTDAHWAEQIAQAHVLPIGAAYTNAALPAVADANQIREAALLPGMSPQQAVKLADAHFAACGVRCERWVINVAAADAQVGPLIDHLSGAGYARSQVEVLRLARMRRSDLAVPVGVKIIPARSSFRHMRELADEWAQQWSIPNLAEAAVQRLDDPQWESLLAIGEGGRAVATAGVLTVGEIGRIDQVYVSPQFRRQGFGRLILEQVLDLCARGMLRHVMLAASPGDAGLMGLLRGMGFEAIGGMTVLDRQEVDRQQAKNG